jgi:DNA invertase Pin-like site-specific DNA recombinase
MIYGVGRVSTDGQSVAAQVAALRKHGAGKMFREAASGAKTDQAQLRRGIASSTLARFIHRGLETAIRQRGGGAVFGGVDNAAVRV